MVAFTGHVVGWRGSLMLVWGYSSRLFGVEMDRLGALLLRHLGARVASRQTWAAAGPWALRVSVEDHELLLHLELIEEWVPAGQGCIKE